MGGIALVFGMVVFVGAPYVPSKRREIRAAFCDLYRLSPQDTLVDIGAGDGIVLREASRLGARAIGYEINPFLVGIARWLSRHDARVSVRFANFWTTDLPPETTVIYAFGESRDITRMARRVAREATRLAKPLMFISYAFAVPGQHPIKQVGAYYLYRIAPLHTDKS